MFADVLKNDYIIHNIITLLGLFAALAIQHFI